MRREMIRMLPCAACLAVWMFSACLAHAAAGDEDEAGFRPIFDGKSLAGWEGDERFWSVQDGAITGQTTAENPTRGNTFLLWTAGELDDFELRLSFRIEGGNSGIQYRSEHIGNYVVRGYQADIDSGERYSGILYEEKARGILAERGQRVVLKDGPDGKLQKEITRIGDAKELQSHIRPGQWNEYRIVARGNHLTHIINGQTMSEVIDETAAARRSGILALQLHAGPPMKVQFKDIRLKRLRLADKKKVVFVAGRQSHGYGAHEFYAGCLLLKKCLDENAPEVLSTIYRNGWPSDPTAFDNADGIVLYLDGGGGHPINNRLEEFDAVMKRGVGLACLHFAVEVPAGKPGHYFLDWLGGYFETFWSVNPHWTLEKTQLHESHPIARGVRPWVINDEWYYHMRFREDGDVQHVLLATPPDATRRAERSARGGNPEVAARKGMAETLAWARQRPDGGRGFGFTGGHVHWNWAHDDFRTLVLNAIVWVAGCEVPADGVRSATPTLEELMANQDEPVPANFNHVQLRQRYEEMVETNKARAAR
jgi:type 1 glutamine amidotransferase